MLRDITGVLLIFCMTLAAMAEEPPAQGLEAQDVLDSEPVAETTNFLGLPAAPLTEPIATDRPDFTETADAVPYGHIQLESGYTFTLDKENGLETRDHTAPELLLRIGLVRDVELRLGWVGYSYTHTREATVVDQEGGGMRRVIERDWEQGGNDLSIGAKFHLLDQDGIIPSLGIITALSVPSGSANVSSGDVEPGVNILWAYDVTECFSIAGSVGANVLRDGTHQFFQTTSSVSFAYSWNDKFGTYFEYFGFYPDVIDEDCAHNLNTGCTYLITDNLQLDFRVGFGVNEQAPDFFSGVGLSWRF